MNTRNIFYDAVTVLNDISGEFIDKENILQLDVFTTYTYSI